MKDIKAVFSELDKTTRVIGDLKHQFAFLHAAVNMSDDEKLAKAHIVISEAINDLYKAKKAVNDAMDQMTNGARS
ncbi:MAG TPA: hypothetical protein VD994_17970 [Prosthecobacter sp.]|nr:hypothetical protein [Prosthecobacter sp.]